VDEPEPEGSVETNQTETPSPVTIEEVPESASSEPLIGAVGDERQTEPAPSEPPVSAAPEPPPEEGAAQGVEQVPEPATTESALPTESKELASEPEEEPAKEPVVALTEEATASTEAVSSPAVAREISLEQCTVDLLKFIRFSDFVPCDYNADGVIDSVVLNSRVSTGYGYRGIGNGIFTEGPSFDLPFRPAAAVHLGPSCGSPNGLLLVSTEGTVSIFYPVIDEDPSMLTKTSPLFVFRVDTADGPLYIVYGKDEEAGHVYGLQNGGLVDKGEVPVSRTSSNNDWYTEITAWQLSEERIPFPLPPEGMEKITRIDDLNDDAIPDLITYVSGNLSLLLSQNGEPLAKEQTVPCHTKPTAIRLADVDGNGLLDVLALMPSGTLEVYLVTSE